MPNSIVTRFLFTVLIALLLMPVFVQVAPPEAVAQTEQYVYKGPRLDGMRYTFIGDYSLRILAFEAGEIDIVGVLPKDLDRIMQSKPIAEWGGEVYRTIDYTTLGVLQMNVRDRIGNPEDPNAPYNVLSDINIRKALAHLFDRDRIINGPNLKGHAIKTTTIVPSMYGDWVHPDKSKVDYEILYPFSIEKANQILDEAGYVWPDGSEYRVYTVPEGYPGAGETRVLEIEIMTFPEERSPVYVEILNMLIENAKQVGIKITPKFVTPAAYSVAVYSRNFQAYIMGWLLGMYPTYVYYFWHSSEDRWVDGKPEGWNRWGVRHPELDQALDQFMFTSDMEEAKRALWRAQEILTQEIIPWVPTYSRISYTAVSGKVKNIVLDYAPPNTVPVGISWVSYAEMALEDPGTGTPIVGGEIKQAIFNIRVLNPMTYNWADESAALNKIYQWLITPNPNNIYDLNNSVKLLITGWKVEDVEIEGEPGTKITLFLRKGVKWHDGTEFTAYDIKFTIEVAGKEWRTLRYYTAYVRQLYKIEVQDLYTVSLYLKGKSWYNLISLLFLRPLPAHIISKLSNPFGDLGQTPHPANPELTALVGNGIFVLDDYIPGREIIYKWYPEFYSLPEEKLPVLDGEVPSLLEEGSSLDLQFTVLDHHREPATNATVVAELSGPVSSSVRLDHQGGGVFTGSIPNLAPGDYVLNVKVEIPLKYGTLRASFPFEIQVYPKGVPPPPEITQPPTEGPAVGEGITLPEKPSLPEPVELPTEGVVGVSQIVTMPIITVVLVVVLSFLVARRLAS